jgi:hypothetical protein
MPSAVVTGAVSRVYVSVWFLYDQTLMEVVAVNKITASCTCIEDSNRTLIELPIESVANLAAMFGNS